MMKLMFIKYLQVPGPLQGLQQSFGNILYNYPHFMDEKLCTRKTGNCPRSHVQKTQKPGFELALSGFISHTVNDYSI